MIEVIIGFDCCPDQTTWYVTESKKDLLVASSSSYYSDLAHNTTTQKLCLNEGKYVFSIHDSTGNGLCCLERFGYYYVISYSSVIAIGGFFEFSESMSFEIPFVLL